jgi:hypothetical protein
MPTDILAEELEAFKQWSSAIHFLLADVRYPSSLKNDASSAYQSIALEHCQTIYRLLSEGSPTSAFALLRSQFDATLRGFWVRIGWTTAEISAFLRDELDMPSLGTMISGLEEKDPDCFPTGQLSAYKARVYSDLCDLNHGGVYQLRAWMQGGEIKPTSKRQDMAVVLRIAAHLSRLNCRELLVIAQDMEGQSRLVDAFNRTYDPRALM